MKKKLLSITFRDKSNKSTNIKRKKIDTEFILFNKYKIKTPFKVICLVDGRE